MKALEEYYHWFFLPPYAENYQLASWEKKLRVAPIKKVSQYHPLSIDANNFAFAEKNNNWITEYFHGLKEFLLIEKTKFAPIFICDNHNHVLSFWYQILYEKKLLRTNISLIHIDQHSDCRKNNSKLELTCNCNTAFDFANNQCNVWNFIPPALECGLISDQTQIRSYETLKNFKINKNQNYILDIDLDFCLSWTNRNKIDEILAHELKNKFDEIAPFSLCISIATSPYFIDQNIAIKLVENLLK